MGGGQGSFLLMRKDAKLKGGQGRFLLKGGSADKIKSLQKKRSELEKKLDKARSKDKESIRKKIAGINRLINNVIGGGCGCMAGLKYRGFRGGSAPLDYAMKAAYFHDQPRAGNHSGGKRKSKKGGSSCGSHKKKKRSSRKK